jgi:DNA-binding NtrC family response regulator
VTHAEIDFRRYSVLAVDDESENLDVLRYHLRDEFALTCARGPEEALAKASAQEFAVILTDQRMPKQSGLEMLSEMKRRAPRSVGVIISAYSEQEIVLAALNSGLVYRYLTKPWKRDELFSVLRGAIERYALEEENQRLISRLRQLNAYFDAEDRSARPKAPIGITGGLQNAADRARQVAPTQATVLLLGESGTGKEVFARYIHERSLRREKPFIRVNLAALPVGTIESELFGHKKGAFTDATSDRAGRFELANGGTLFLDEIGELPLSTQVKLLRVLQEREIERVGDARAISIDTRLICATHRDLGALMAEGKFREDLYYRINVFPIPLPPLRERPQDIPPLVEHLGKLLAARVGRAVGVSHEALKILVEYRWPGNVRELENVLERAMILAAGKEISAPLIQRCLGGLAGQAPGQDLQQELLEAERRTLLDAIQRAGNSKKRAAELLGISRSTLYYRLNRVGLSTDEP